jgi:hypothetical protein
VWFFDLAIFNGSLLQTLATNTANVYTVLKTHTRRTSEASITSGWVKLPKDFKRLANTLNTVFSSYVRTVEEKASTARNCGMAILGYLWCNFNGEPGDYVSY